jgi:cytochrome c peroxidase
MKIEIPLKISFLKNYYFIYILGLCIVTSCTDDDSYTEIDSKSALEMKIVDLYGSKQALVLPFSSDLNAIPSDPNNPITKAKVDLGKLLFHETGLAKNPNVSESTDSYSCASCHHSNAGFQSGLKQGIGEGGIGFGISGEGRHKNPAYQESDLDVQPIRSPSIINTAYQEVMLWNGQFGAKGVNQGTEANWTPGTPKEKNNLGFEGLETQAIAGLAVHRLSIDENFLLNTVYKEMFDESFPNLPADERYTSITAGLAIAAYERTVLSNESPFQQWLRGNDLAMDENETRGALLFFDKAKCYQCHSGPGLNGMEFHAIGMNDLEGSNILTAVDNITKRGRGGFTGNPEDDFKFKTPQLYNLADVNFYGHGANFTSLTGILKYKNEAIKENSEVPQSAISQLFTPLNLTDEEIDDIVAFLETGLYDSNLQRYVPTALPSGNCFPNADELSSLDLGCN